MKPFRHFLLTTTLIIFSIATSTIVALVATEAAYRTTYELTDTKTGDTTVLTHIPTVSPIVINNKFCNLENVSIVENKKDEKDKIIYGFKVYTFLSIIGIYLIISAYSLIFEEDLCNNTSKKSSIDRYILGE